MDGMTPTPQETGAPVENATTQGHGAPDGRGSDGREPLARALIESRARWRDFALLAADILFETDAEGCFSFLAPEMVLGHTAESLLGTPASALLAGLERSAIGPCGGPRSAKAWLVCADGSPACLDLTLLPVLPGLPNLGGLRGAARDITAQERLGEVTARALRRAHSLGRLLRLGQRQGGAASAMAAMLGALPAALGCQGAALLLPEADGWRIAELAEAPPPLHLLPPPGGRLPPGRLALASTESGPCLLAWRAEDQPAMEADDRDLLEALALPMAALRAEMLRQRELAAAAECDALTGLLNRRGFTAALAGRIGRQAGALVFIDLDGLKPLNDGWGHEAGDAALRAMAARLREAATPEDLAARLGGDEYCLWLHATGPEEAALRTAGIGAPGPLADWPDAGPEALRASIGIAVPSEGESVAALLARADAAMYAAKRAKQGERRR